MKSKMLYMLIGALVVFGLSLAPMAGAADFRAKDLTGHYRGSDFMNMSVKNDSGEHLGYVKDFVFDRDGDLRWLVVSRASTADMLVPIPYSSGMVTFQDNAVVVHNLDRSRLDAAPTFSSYEWRMLDDPTFESRVHGYYGYEDDRYGTAEKDFSTRGEPVYERGEIKQSPITSGDKNM